MDYLQKWWEEKYPEAIVSKVINVSEGVLDLEHLIDFERWIVKNFNIQSISNNEVKCCQCGDEYREDECKKVHAYCPHCPHFK